METETLTDITENRDAAMTAVNTENPETASDQAETTELLKGENAASDCNRIGIRKNSQQGSCLVVHKATRCRVPRQLRSEK